ncbi:MAG: cysteine hydrolase [Pseudomonadota bacterium]
MKQIAADPYPWPFDGAFSRENTAFLILGYQQRAVDELAAHPALATTTELLERWRDAGGRTFFSRRGVETLSSARRWRNERRQIDRILRRGAPGWALAVEPRDNEPVVDHVGDSAFYASDLDHLLRRANAKNLIMAGLPTDGIVHATMREANDRGYECLLVADACTAHDQAIHQGILKITVFGNGLFGTVAPASVVFEALA